MKRNVMRFAAYAAVLLATIVLVYVTTRGQAAAAPQAGRHDHGAAAVSPAAKPVALSVADARRIGVTYTTATRGSFSKDVRTVGQITFDETRVRSMTSKVDGWVEQLFVNATGQYVSQGQALFALYSPMLVSAQEELLLARRLEADVSAGGPGTRENARDLLASARRRLAYWDIPESDIAQIERSRKVRRTLVIHATAAGYVLEKNVFSGQRIMAGDPLYKVADLSTVWAEGEVFEQDLATVRVGQAVRAELDALPGTHRVGRISYIYPTVDAETRTARVRVVLANGDMALKPGMYATIQITGAVRRDVVTVPRSAVLSTGERSIVFVREANDHLVPREVAVGATSGDRVEILQGVTVGETVVTSATFLVDAESNLGTALGGMGNMPGMDVTTPPKPLTPPRKE